MSVTVVTRRRDSLSVAVRNARRAKGLSQRELAEAIRVHKGTISNLERGVVEPEPVTISRLEEILGVDLSPERLYREGTVTLAVEEIERKFRRIPEEHRLMFVSQVIGYVTAWSPPVVPVNGGGLSALDRARFEREVRGIPGITESQVASALSHYDTSGL